MPNPISSGKAFTPAFFVKRQSRKGFENTERKFPRFTALCGTGLSLFSRWCFYTTPCAIIALATFMKPATFAPFT